MKHIALLILLQPFFTSITAKELPVEYFFRNYEFSQLTLSPDGKHLAAIAPIGSSMNLVIIDRVSKKSSAITSLKKRDISSYQWASNSRIVFYIEKDGYKSQALNAVNIDGSKPIGLTHSHRNIQLISRHTKMVRRLKEDDRNILVINNTRREQFPDLYRLDLFSGRTKRLTFHPDNIVGWGLDWNNKVRIAIRQIVKKDKSNVTHELLYRETEESPWKILGSTSLGEETTNFSGFTNDNKKIYMTSAKGRDKTALFMLDPATGKKEMVFGHDDVDISGLYFSPKDHRLLSVNYFTELPKLHNVDQKFASIQKAIDKALPSTVNRITSLTDDEKTAVIRAFSDRSPGTFYLMETEPKFKLTFLAKKADRIKEEDMVDMKPISYTARDGLEVHGYLTIPKDVKGKKVPLIINPHGGPFGTRDYWSFNPEIQFLANRGYAVLQMNFRGSGGYGNKFEVDAWQQWGLQMQDDITDALDWAVEQGIADHERVCIYGASYGGYAAMAALTITPELYKCGINYAGIVDLNMFEKWNTKWDLDGGLTTRFHKTIGNPNDPKDRDRMEKTSPINMIENLKSPLFIIHGRRDSSVEINQAEKLMGKMDELNKPYTKLIKKKEGHGFRREKNKLELYKMMDEFLKKNL